MDNISKIKDRLGVVDVISGYLKVQKAGVNFKAPCPFHNEKTPSFFVSPERQIWHCFGCQKGGDIFTFIKEIEGVEFPEALRILAARAGIELEEFDSAAKDSKDRLYQICELSSRFFEKQLNHSNIGQRAVEYLKGRGLEEGTMAKFRFGFAPDTWDALSNYLRNSGFTEKEIIDAGVVVKKEAGGIYDRFRSRIMFPISDVNGRVVGFTGRIFEPRPESIEGQYGPSTHSTSAQGGEQSRTTSSGRQAEPAAKYINTPQTLIYDKSRILYGLDHSRGEIRKKDKCLLVEGNMDAIMSHQAGVVNVVASSGTALTSMQLSILKRYTNNLDFCFDTDSAGALATKRGIGMALGQDFSVKVVSLDDSECKDPADYVQKYGSNPAVSGPGVGSQALLGNSVGASWMKVVEKAKPVMEFYFEKAKENYRPESAESKKRVISTVAPFIKRLASRVEKSHWVSQLAYLLRVKEEAIEGDIATVPDELNIYENTASIQKEKVNPAVVKTETTDDQKKEMELISLAIARPALLQNQTNSSVLQFLSPTAASILTELAKESSADFKIGDFIKKFDSEKALNLEFANLNAQVYWSEHTDEELMNEFLKIINMFKEKNIKSRIAELSYELGGMQLSGDNEKIKQLHTVYNELMEQLAAIHKI